MDGRKKVRIKLGDISIMLQIQRSRRKRRHSLGMQKLRRLVLASSVILKLMLLILISMSSRTLQLAHCHNNHKSYPQAPPPQVRTNAQEGQKVGGRAASQDFKLERLTALMRNLLPSAPGTSSQQRQSTSEPADDSRRRRQAEIRPASSQLKKLLARPRQLLSSFVPHIHLGKQMIPRRPRGVAYHNPLISAHEFLGGGGADADRGHKRAGRPPLLHPGAYRGFHENQHFAIYHAPPIALHSALTARMAPRAPLSRSLYDERFNLVGLPPGGADQVAAFEEGDSAVGSARDANQPPDGTGSGLVGAAEHSLSQIDQMIKSEFETRLSLNERHIEQAAARERRANENEQRASDASSSMTDATLPSPLTQAADEPTTVQPSTLLQVTAAHRAPSPTPTPVDAQVGTQPSAVFLAWPPRAGYHESHEDEERPPRDRSTSGDRQQASEFSLGQATLLAPPPTSNTRRSRDNSRRTPEIVVGRPLAPPSAPSSVLSSASARAPQLTSSADRSQPKQARSASSSTDDERPISAFVPSALETIAQLKLNQTNGGGGASSAQVMPSNVPTTIASATSGRKSQQQQQQQQQQAQRQAVQRDFPGERISLLNGRPTTFSAPLADQHLMLAPGQWNDDDPNSNSSIFDSHYHAGASERAQQQQHYQNQQRANPPRPSRQEPSLAGGWPDGGLAAREHPADLRETLRRLRETKAKIRQLQAELSGSTGQYGAGAGGLFMSETNKTITQYVDQPSVNRASFLTATSDQVHDDDNDNDAAAEPERVSRGLEWFRSWSPPFNRSSGSIFVPAQIVRAQQSMNMPLGLYYNGPLTTPARLVASALGRTVQHSVGAPLGPATPPRPKSWSSALGGNRNLQVALDQFAETTTSSSEQPAKANGLSARPSPAPAVLLGSSITVASAGDQPPTTTLSPAPPSHQNKASTDNASFQPSDARPPPPGQLVQAAEATTGGDKRDQQRRLQAAPVLAGGSRAGVQGDNNGRRQAAAAAAAAAEGGHERAHKPSAMGTESGDAPFTLVATLATSKPAQAPPATTLSSQVLPPSTPASDDELPSVAPNATHNHRSSESENNDSQGGVKMTSISSGGQRQVKQQRFQPPAPSHRADDKRPPSIAPLNHQSRPVATTAVARATESPIVIVANARPSQSLIASTLREQLVASAAGHPSQRILGGGSGDATSRATNGERVAIIASENASNESDRKLLASNSTQAFDEPEPAPGRSSPASDNFLARLLGDFVALFKSSSSQSGGGAQASSATPLPPIRLASSGGAHETHASDQQQQPFQVARSLGSRAHSMLANHSTQQQQQQQAAGKLTTEKLARNLIVVLSSLSLVSLIAVLLFVRLQQACRTRCQTFNEPQSATAAAAAAAAATAADGDDAHLFFGLEPQQQQQQPRCSDWRRLGPMSLIGVSKQQQQHRADKLILDGTMRNVSLIAKHHRQQQVQGQLVESATGAAAAAADGAIPRPTMNRSCCHCVSCSESWLFRDAQQQHGDTPLCSSGFYHPAPRGKLPFGAASSVNNMLEGRGERASGRRQQAVAPKSALSAAWRPQRQEQLGCNGEVHAAGNQRAPIGGTRLRMMSAIEERDSTCIGCNGTAGAPDDEWHHPAMLMGHGQTTDELEETQCTWDHEEQQQRADNQCTASPNTCCGHCGAQDDSHQCDQDHKQRPSQQHPLEASLEGAGLDDAGASFIVLKRQQQHQRVQQRDNATTTCEEDLARRTRCAPKLGAGQSEMMIGKSAPARRDCDDAPATEQLGSTGCRFALCQQQDDGQQQPERLASSVRNGNANKLVECHSKHPGDCGDRSHADDFRNCSRLCQDKQQGQRQLSVSSQSAASKAAHETIVAAN